MYKPCIKSLTALNLIKLHPWNLIRFILRFFLYWLIFLFNLHLLLFAKTEFSNCFLDWLISPGSTQFKMATSLGSVFLQASFFSLWDYVIIKTHSTSTPECSRKCAQCGRAKACAQTRLTAPRFGQKSKAVVQIQGVSKWNG